MDVNKSLMYCISAFCILTLFGYIFTLDQHIRESISSSVQNNKTNHRHTDRVAPVRPGFSETKIENSSETEVTCSVEFLRNFSLKNKEIYTDGFWSGNYWTPQKCFLPKNVPRLEDCLSKFEIRKIIILGDSNGRRYGDVVVKYLQKNFSCSLLKKEKEGTMFPDDVYFKDVKNIELHARDCITCRSFLYHCQSQVSKMEVYVEYIAMEYYMDNEMTTRRRGPQCNPHQFPFKKYRISCGESITTQQFIFNEYLYTQKHYPTLVLIIGNHHEPNRRGVIGLRRDLNWFLQLLKQVLHNNTKVFWFEPTYAKKAGWMKKYANSTGYQEYADLAFQVMLEYYESDPNLFYPFYGIFNASLGKPDWLQDGMHYKKSMYSAIVDLFFQTLCH